MTDRYAVIGNPVSHSLSPRIHARFAAATQQDLIYDKLEAPVDGFASAVERFFDAGGKGLNITLPFKIDAWRWVDDHDDAARRCGAVNTILRHGTASRGCCTDGCGLVTDLIDNLGWRLQGARTLMLGAGGAAQGVVPALVEAGATDLTIANRTRRKAELLAERFAVRASDLGAVSDGWDVVVNATSASIGDDRVRIAPQAVAGSRCYDLFYSLQSDTAFCRWAAEHGALATSDGLGMLVEQAAAAFALWRGVKPSTAGIVAALRRGDGAAPGSLA